MSLEKNKALVERFLEEIPNKGNVSIIDEFISPDFKLYVPGDPHPHDYEAFIRFVHQRRTAFAGFHDHVEEWFVEEDKVAIRVTVSGIHQGEFQGIAPTGKPVSVTAYASYHIANGKLTEMRFLLDVFRILEQIGANSASVQSLEGM